MSGKPRRIAAQRTVRLGGRELPLDSEVLERAAKLERAAYLARRAELAPLPPVAERSGTGEAAWQAQVVKLAQRLEFYVYHPKLSRWSERGWPDLSLLGRRALWIECKDDDGQLTEKQVEVIDRMRACGLEVHVLRPWHGLQLVAELLQQCPHLYGPRQGAGRVWALLNSDPEAAPVCIRCGHDRTLQSRG